MAGDNNKIHFKGNIVTLCTQKVTLPNGYSLSLEIIEHPGAVLIIPFLSVDKIVLIRQFRPVINAYIYELPAGTLENNEHPRGCARREMREEIGYRANKLSRIGIIYPLPGYSTEKIYIYQAQELRKCSCNTQDDEVIELYEVTKKQMKKLIREGKIVDAKTLSALALCGWA